MSNKSPMTICPECGWFSFITNGASMFTAIDAPGDPCKYGCGPVRMATDREVEWFNDPTKNGTLAAQQLTPGA